MAMRVGIDICAIDDVVAAIEAHGRRYLDRVFTARELRDCTVDGRLCPDRLAARFAGKEAVIKVLRPVDTGIDLRAVEVVARPGGWTCVELRGVASRLADDAEIDDLALSLTHERPMAAAVAVARTSADERSRTQR